MSVISKFSVPSLFDMAILNYCSNVAYAFPMLNHNAGFWNRTRYSSSFDILSGIVSNMRYKSKSGIYSRQKKGQTLVSIAALNSDKLQRFNNQNGLECSTWFVPHRVLFIAIISKYLQDFHSETSYSNPFELSKRILALLKYLKPVSDTLFLPIPIEMKRFAKYLEKFFKSSEILVILKTFFQISPTMSRLVVYLEHSRKSYEVPVNLYVPEMPLEVKLFVKDSEQFKLPIASESTTGFDNTESQSLKPYQQEDELKLLGMCYLCKEMISKKKFFDERRFGILRKCACMICYGCLRKKTGTTGVVEGPVECPLCSVESDIVAASARWVEGEEKLKFFEFLQKHDVPKIKLDLTSRALKTDHAPASACLVKGREKSKISDLQQKRGTSQINMEWTQCFMKSDKVLTACVMEKENIILDFLQKYRARKVKWGCTGFTKKEDFCSRIPTMMLVN